MATRESFTLFSVKVKECLLRIANVTGVSLQDANLTMRVYTKRKLTEEERDIVCRELGKEILEFVSSEGQFQALKNPKIIRGDLPPDEPSSIERVTIR